MEKPIRILHVLQRMEAGGTQALLMNLYRNIDRNKVQFDFLVEYPNKQFYDDEILAMGGRIYYTNIRNDKNLLKFKHKLKEIICDNHYKIIHVHTYSIGYFVLKCAQKYGIPVRIAHSHSNCMTHDYKMFLKLVLKKLYPVYATNYMACSKEAGEFLFYGKKYMILNNSRDAKKFIFSEKIRENVRKKLNLDDKFVVGHVGRFRPEKNHLFLLDIFYEIKKKKSNAQLLLIGNEDSNKEIRNKISQLNLSNNLIILNNRTDINELYQAMDVFIFPSLYEGLGIAAIEAQASGIPCVCADTLPEESNISRLFMCLSLNEKPSVWAEKAIEHSKSNMKFRNMYNDVCNNNYDILKNAKVIEKYYCDLYENEVINEKSIG